jgi:uncharacterized protein YndB with AHSA1/START domain
MLNTLQVTTPTDREIVMSRVFNAPRQMVWDAMTKPDLIRRWLFGPPGWTMTACEDDARPGGTFRWAWRGPEGQDMQMRGTYREVVPPAPGGAGGRMVRTESFEFGCVPQAGEQVCTLVVAEHGAKTKLTLTIVYPSKEARDATIASGMAKGVSAGYDKLDEMLAGSAL